MLSRRLILAFAIALVATVVNAELALADVTVTVTNNAGVPINVQIGPKSFALKAGGVAAASLNTTRKPVFCINTISAAATLTNGTVTKTITVKGKPVAVTEPRTTTVYANPVQTNVCTGGRRSFTVTKSGEKLKIN